jgi:predicted esterase
MRESAERLVMVFSHTVVFIATGLEDRSLPQYVAEALERFQQEGGGEVPPLCHGCHV